MNLHRASPECQGRFEGNRLADEVRFCAVRRSLLLAETDPTFADALARVAAASGFSLVTIPDGALALERALVTKPDAVALASELPTLSGFAVCNRLRKGGLVDTPVVLLIGSASPGAVESHRQCPTPADDYVFKPVSAVELAQRLTDLLDARLPLSAAGAPPPAAPSPELDAARDQAEDGAEAEPAWLSEITEPRIPVGLPLADQLSLLHERLHARDQLIERARADWHRLSRQIAEGRGRAANLGDALAARERELDALEAGSDAALAAADEQLRRALERIGELTAAAAARPAAPDHRPELDLVRAEAERHRADAERHRADAESHRADAERHHAGAERHRGDAERLHGEAERHRAEVERLRADADRPHAEVERLRAAEVERLRAELAAKAGNARDAGASDAELRQTVEALTRERAALRADLGALRVSLEAAEVRAHAAEQALASERARATPPEPATITPRGGPRGT